MREGDRSARARRGTLAGQHVAGHELVRVLASGGMGEVYLARHLTLDMLRAIKVIHNNLREHEDAQIRFAREAQVLARLSHNSIVQIIDFGALSNGWPYLAMEYIDGPNLEQVVESSGPMALSLAILVLEQIASALHYAHEQNVIHRDLKPANVLVRGGDPRQVKVIDFGLAYTHDDGQLRLTAEGQMVGSPLYMAPEQGAGSVDVTAAVDVYALGGVAYTLLSGKPPFHGMSMLQLLSSHADESPPRLGSRCPELPRFLDELLYACLAKDPSARPHIDELVGHLARLARTTEPGPPVPAISAPSQVTAMGATMAAPRGSESAIARLIDRPPPDDGSGVAPALVNQMFAIIGDLAVNLSSEDRELSVLHAESERARSDLTELEMEMALIDATLEHAPSGPRAALIDDQRKRAARVRDLKERGSELLRQMIGRVEVQRGRGDGAAVQLFAEVDQVLEQLYALPNGTR